MEIEGKVWGTTSTLFNKNNVKFDRIVVKKGTFCSKHLHDSTYNSFFIESGELKIKVWKNDYALTDETILRSGQMTTVSPKEFHSFEALENTVAFEIYWVSLSKDIKREYCGGKIDTQD